MSKQTVTLRVSIDDGWDAGDRIQIYTDFGSGTVDLTRPLLPRPKALFPGREPARGYGRQPLGMGRIGDGKAARPHRGVGRAIYGKTPYGTAPPFVSVPVHVPSAHGLWKFAVQVISRLGTVQAGALQEIQAVVSGTDPPPPASLSFAGYDAVSDQVTLNFTKDTE